MLPGAGLLAREEYGRVGVAGRIGKVPEGLYSNWERLAFHGQGNNARDCKGRRVGWSEWWRKDERGSHRCGGGVGVEKM